MISRHWVLLASVLLFSCSQEQHPAGSHPDWLTGYGPTRGHEDLVRFAVSSANRLLTQPQFFSEIPKGENGLTSQLPMVQGVTDTDFPNQELLNRYHATTRTWHTNPDLQDLHYLRNYAGSTDTVSFADACEDGKNRILASALEAWESFEAGNQKRGLFYLGHALHTIQDSFSSAHTQRSGDDLKVLSDICSYQRPESQSCHHKEVDERDRIWKLTVSCQLNPNARSWDCLTKNAQRAVYASTGFLYVMGEILQGSSSRREDVESRLKEYFETSRWGQLSGYFQCHQLAAEESSAP